MAISLLRLPKELHLQVFEHLYDLDNTRELARVCSYHFRLHKNYKRIIARLIIVSQRYSS